MEDPQAIHPVSCDQMPDGLRFRFSDSTTKVHPELRSAVVISRIGIFTFFTSEITEHFMQSSV